MNLKELDAPFEEKDVEWRLTRSGIGNNGKPWGRSAVYLTARVVQKRLDEVCGKDGWEVKYQILDKGVIAILKIGDRIKEDGADYTDSDAFKGGISGALKRAACAWGVGRYLYEVEEGFAEFVDADTPGARYAKIERQVFHWLPPMLPDWAMAKSEGSRDTRLPVAPIPRDSNKSSEEPLSRLESPVSTNIQAPTNGNGNGNGDLADYVMGFGQYKGQRLMDVVEKFGVDKLESYSSFMRNRISSDKKAPSKSISEGLTNAEEYCRQLAVTDVQPDFNDVM